MKKLAIIGCGRIGSAVIRAVQNAEAGDFSLLGVLSRTRQEFSGLNTQTDADSFFSLQADLIIDVSTGAGLQAYGERALQCADLWTVNPAALAKPGFLEQLENLARERGHSLRVLSGAIAGLDGLAALAVDQEAHVQVDVDVAPSPEGRKILFEGSVREAAQKFPESVNVAAAAAIAGVGFERTAIRVIQPAACEERKLSLIVQSRFGRHEIISRPIVNPAQEIHAVAACVISALRQADAAIQIA